MDKLQSEPGPCTGTCLMSSDGGNQVVGIKVEDGADLKLEEDPLPTTSPLIKTEPLVSCVSVCASCLAHCTYISSIFCHCVFFLHKIV